MGEVENVTCRDELLVDLRHAVRRDAKVAARELHAKQTLEAPFVAFANDGLESAGLLQRVQRLCVERVFVRLGT